MRTIALILAACVLAVKDVAADKDKPFVILAGELKQITDAVKSKVEHLRAKWQADVKAAEEKSEPAPAADPAFEIYDSYSGAANQHGPGIQFTISARKLQALTSLLPEGAKVDPPKPPAPVAPPKP